MENFLLSLSNVYKGMYNREGGLLGAFLMLLGSFVALAIGYNWWRHTLKKTSTSSTCPTFSLFVFLKNLNRMLEFNTEVLTAIPGHTYRCQHPGGFLFVTANPVNVEHILKTNFENYPKGEFFYENLKQLLGNGIFSADDDLWRLQRKVASYEFTTRSLRDFVLESAAREAWSRLVPVLSAASQSGEQIDLQDLFTRFAFDNVCQLAFGVDPACLDPSLPNIEFAVAFDNASSLCMQRMQCFPKWLWNLQSKLNIGKPKELQDSVRVIDEFAYGVIDKRREELAHSKSVKQAGGTFSGKSDLLSRFMALVEDEQGLKSTGNDFGLKRWMQAVKGEKPSRARKLSDVFLRDMMISFILAGRDTPTAGVSWFFWILSSHPADELKILEEMASLLSARPADTEDPDEDFVTFGYEDLKNMHYLHAALSESMRLYPPVPADFKTTRKADVWPDGTVITPNSIVAYHAFAMARTEDLWGKDCLEFKCERWLKNGEFVPQNQYKYPIFHAGPRICLGKDMVMLQMKTMCAAVLSNFEFSVADGYKAKPLEALTMRIRDGLPLTVKRRINSPWKKR